MTIPGKEPSARASGDASNPEFRGSIGRRLTALSAFLLVLFAIAGGLSVYGARPIYLLAAHGDIPGSVAYPRDAIQAHFAWGGQPEECFTSSLDWMLALAIYEGFMRIELYGVDLWDASHERGTQRNGAHYWIGQARGRGIDVVIPDSSSLCKTERLYGYFTQTSGRNFSSISMHRFMAQLTEAQRLNDPAYVPPGLDTPVAV